MTQANDQVAEIMSSLFTVVRSTSKGIERMGIDKASMIVLYSVKEQHSARPSAIASYCGLDLSTISRHLKRLEEEGFIERRQDPLDGRAQLTNLSAYGAETLAKIDRLRRDAMETALGAWSESERDDLSAVIARLADDLVTTQARIDAGLTSTKV